MILLKTISQALRSIRAFRFYSLVNISGLALSLACSTLFFSHIHRKTTAVSLFTLRWQTRAAAGENPARAIKTE